MLQNLLLNLLLFPALIAAFLGLNRDRRLQKAGVFVAAGLLFLGGTGSGFLSGEKLFYTAGWLEPAMVIGSVVLTAALAYLTGLRRNYPAMILVLIQWLVWGWFWLKTGGVNGGIGFQLDRLSALLLLTTNWIGAVTLYYAIPYLETHDRRRNAEANRQPVYFSASLLIMTAMNGLLLSDHLLVWFLCWQLMILAGFILISHDRTERAVSGGRVFVNIQLAGGIFYLLGAVFLRSATPGLAFSELLLIADSSAFSFALAFLVIASMAAAGLFPFQTGLFKTLAAPLPAIVLLQCASAPLAGVALLIRLSPLLVNTLLGKTVMVLGAFSFAAAALLILLQQDTRRFFVLAAISLQGLVLALICQANLQSIYLAVLTLVFYSLAKALLWLCTGSHSTSKWNQGFLLLAVIMMLLPPFIVPTAQLTGLESSLQNPPALLLLIAGFVFFWLGWARFGSKRWEGFSLSESSEKFRWTMIIPQAALALPVMLIGFLPGPFINRCLKPILQENYGRFADIAQADAQTLNLAGFSGYNPLWVWVFLVLVLVPGWIWLRPEKAEQPQISEVPHEAESGPDVLSESLSDADTVVSQPTEPAPNESSAIASPSSAPTEPQFYFRDVFRSLQPILPESKKVLLYSTIGAAGLLFFMLEVVWR